MINKNFIPIIQLVLLLSASLYSQSGSLSWAKGIVWYQIFPERFANGDKENDPDAAKTFPDGKTPAGWTITPWTSDWFHTNYHYNQRRYGGDLKGIIDHLDYLKDLGVTGIYLNPMFEAVSSHKYDGSSYHHIDVNFGPDPGEDRKLIATETPDDPTTWKWTKADLQFLRLIQEVHKRNMKIIIDGVFNHVGTEFWAFKDLKKNQDTSKYKEWFQVKSFDNPDTKENEFDYQGWWNSKGLPQFNRTDNDLNAGPKKYIFYATQRWMDPNENGEFSDGIDGWRLDVARDVPLGFWKDWSSYVKRTNPQAIIIGELWEISKDFISTDGPFDALMNYNFAYAINKYFTAKKNKISTGSFIELLNEINESYPDSTVDLLQNLIDSHDTERILSMLKNPDRDYDRDGNEHNPNYDPSKPGVKELNRLQLIAAFQMTYKGAPMIYYGDEAGMWGADDPHCRKPMLWKDLKYDNEVIDSSTGFKKGFGSYKVEFDKQLFKFYKSLIAVRNQNSALRQGSVEFFYSDDGNSTFGFKRKDGNQTILCLFNLGTLNLNTTFAFEGKEFKYTDLFTGEKNQAPVENGRVTISVKSNNFRILKLADE